MRQEADADTHKHGGCERRAGLVWQAEAVRQRVVVDEERGGPDAHDPRGQAIQAVDEVDRVDGDDHDQDRGRGLLVGRQPEHAPAGEGQPGHLGAAPDQDHARGDLTGQFAERAQAPPVIDKAHDDHKAAGQQQAPGHVGFRERAGEGGDTAGYEQTRGQAGIHGKSAEQGGGHLVDVTVTGSVRSPYRDREAANRRRQKVGHCSGR